MLTFDMSTADNFASFKDPETGRCVLVDSFDNHEFNVRIGTLEESLFAGVIVASSDQELNARLSELVRKEG